MRPLFHTQLRFPARRLIALVALLVAAVVVLTGCSTAQNRSASSSNVLSQAEQEQSEDTKPTPQVFVDPDQSGIDTALGLYETAESVVLVSEDPDAQARAATVAIMSGAPLLAVTEASGPRISETLTALNTTTVVLIGDVTLPDPNPAATAEGPRETTAAEILEAQGLTVVADPLTDEGVETITAQSVASVQRVAPADLRAAIAGYDREEPVLLATQDTHAETTSELGNFPGLGRADGGRNLVVFSGPEASLAAVGTAVAYGARVVDLPVSDLRATAESQAIAAEYHDASVAAAPVIVGIGRGFQDGYENFTEHVLAAATAPEVVGGGALLFPGRHMVALYGHPSGPALGVMGEQPAEAAAQLAVERAQSYEALVDDPVIPTFEIITTVAQAKPGDDGFYTSKGAPEDFLPYIDAITAAGGYAVLDLQPGREHLLDQAKFYEELLLRPNVGLALDPEWKLGPTQLPMQDIGTVDAAEINEVAAWLAELTRTHDLPQKALILHQFQLSMISNRDQLATREHRELAWVLHVDGHGSPGAKYSTLEVLLQDFPENMSLGWKNFIDEDTPLFTPEATMQVNPQPVFVSYQ